MDKDDWDKYYQEEYTNIKNERTNYKISNDTEIGQKIFEVLSTLFLSIGFISLILVYFTEITLLQSTCFFVIAYTLQPSDGDRYQSIIKGITEDLAHIRLNTTIFSKNIKIK